MEENTDVPKEIKQAILYDSAWVAGAQFGWNCGASGDREALTSAINARTRDKVEALRDARQVVEESQAESSQYCATGYTRVDLEAMHPNIKLEPEWRRCSQCLRENCVETWAKFNGKCPSCGDLFDKEESQAPPAKQLYDRDLPQPIQRDEDGHSFSIDYGPPSLSLAADAMAEVLRKLIYVGDRNTDDWNNARKALATFEKAKESR